MKLVFYPYKMFSQSAKLLAKSLMSKRVLPNGNYVPKRKHIIVNWGSSATPKWWGYIASRNVEVLNPPSAVQTAKNKLTTLQRLRAANVSVPDFTTSKHDAIDWIEDMAVKAL